MHALIIQIVEDEALVSGFLRRAEAVIGQPLLALTPMQIARRGSRAP